MADASAQTDIVNMALDELGQKTIQSIEAPNNAVEKIAARIFPLACKSLLRSHIWNFAIKRENISRYPDAPAFGYADKYQLPNDFVRVVGIGKDDIEYYNEQFSLEDGFILLDNGGASPLKLRYVYYNDNVVTWDSAFTELMVAKLAAKMAIPVTGEVKLAQYHDSIFSAMFAEVISVDSQDTEITLIDSQPAVHARYRYGAYRDDRSKYPG